MRKQYEKILKRRFHTHLAQSRSAMGISQEEMAHSLMMAGRTYVDLEHEKNSCSALTFVLFLLRICTNPMEFLEILRIDIAAELENT